MTFLSTLLAWFPTMVLLLSGTSFLWFCAAPGIGGVLALVFSLYGLPLLVYRLHNRFYPVSEGISYLCGKAYSPWWGSHQIQLIYVAFPALETALRLIPGAFSLWLRLWGSTIGKNVYWTPALEIADRGLLKIGDRVVFGQGIGLYPHAIKPKKQDLMLYVKTIHIGHHSFIGAGSRLGPGVTLPPETYLPAKTDLHPNQKTATSTPTHAAPYPTSNEVTPPPTQASPHPDPNEVTPALHHRCDSD